MGSARALVMRISRDAVSFHSGSRMAPLRMSKCATSPAGKINRSPPARRCPIDWRSERPLEARDLRPVEWVDKKADALQFGQAAQHAVGQDSDVGPYPREQFGEHDSVRESHKDG